MQDYAVGQMNQLLTTLAFQVHRASARPGPKEIHDLRVSIRRFSQGLLLFSRLLPKRTIKKISRRLKRMMQVTSEIRNRDIAIEFVGGTQHAGHRQRLEEERTTYQREFSDLLRRWNARDFSAKWRSDLSLSSV